MPNGREAQIIAIIRAEGNCTSGEIAAALEGRRYTASLATVKRDLAKMVSENLLAVTGSGRGTRYRISDAYDVLGPIGMDAYYSKEIDERTINTMFNWDLFRTVLPGISLFSQNETKTLEELQHVYTENISELSRAAQKKEQERLAIDLSWKSSQIEGNTYSLLETERLLKDKETAAGKTKEEAVMLLNHKDAIDFIFENPDYLNPITTAGIENIHSLLVKELGVDRNIRTRRIGISGTNYQPLDNEFQIKEALTAACDLVNAKKDVFEKALLGLATLSYIQPFMDGNKRTARIVSNAILLGHAHCPISFRTVDGAEYKKAMLIFYEQNNISNFKKIFMEQYAFAVNTYF